MTKDESSHLANSVAEGRLDDFRLSGLSKAQISRIKFLYQKWLYLGQKWKVGHSEYNPSPPRYVLSPIARLHVKFDICLGAILNK